MACGAAVMWPFKGRSIDAPEPDRLVRTYDINCNICGKKVGFVSIDRWVGVLEHLYDGRKFNDVLLGKKYYACDVHPRSELAAFIESSK